ncbi:16S rRNA (guanine(966)-N(2))-methyltransferase RsmD [soil metagenome]
MRVIAGKARGRRLKGPPGPQTRPMADKIREALFSSLASLGVEPVRILDLYAGTGSIGIETLSRGGAYVDFVDHQHAACAVIRTNLAHTKFSEQARVHCMPIALFLRRLEKPYDFVILDPPYADPHIEETLEELGGSPLVQSQTIVVLGHWPRLEPGSRIGRLQVLKRRCHGDSCFSIFEVSDELEDENHE